MNYQHQITCKEKKIRTCFGRKKNQKATGELHMNSEIILVLQIIIKRLEEWVDIKEVS